MVEVTIALVVLAAIYFFGWDNQFTTFAKSIITMTLIVAGFWLIVQVMEAAGY